MKERFEDVIKKFKEVFLKKHNQVFTNQTVETCTGLYHLCRDYDPDKVIEIGTNYGASTISMAFAMHDLKKSLSNIVTVDVFHGFWRETLKMDFPIDLSSINLITQDFNELNPLISAGEKTFIFYDMHDHKGPWSQKLLDYWIPVNKNNLFAIHDITAVGSDFKFSEDLSESRSVAEYFSGQYFAGFNECARIINWVNSARKEIKIFPGGIYFYS